MRTCCSVVIGHVDHGKTALVRALTGTETDRLPEEQERGLSITPGFAHRAYQGGVMDFVDAPGHADFIHGMVSGASGAQAALIVISLADGMEAQTYEHLEIAELLGISKAVIALCKSDLLAASEHDRHISGIRAALATTPFAAAPMVLCSAQTGEGIGNLHGALENLLSEPLMPAQPDHSFLSIDRAFTLPGHGTIVTGTLLGRSLSMGDDVVLQPAKHHVTLRRLQSRGETRKAVAPCERMAANLRGIAAEDIPRGSVLCTAGHGRATQCIDAHITLLAASAGTLKHMQRVRVLFGASSAVAQVRRLKDRAGTTSFVQLRFEAPVAAFAGQRAILRRLSPAETIGGAVFLDPQASPARSGDAGRLEVLRSVQGGDTKAIAKALIKAGHGCARLTDVARLARLSPEQTDARLGSAFVRLSAGMISSSEEIRGARTAMLDALAAYHLRHPLRAMAPRAVIDIPRIASPLLQYVEDFSVADSTLRRQANMLALSDHDPVAQLNDDQRADLSALEDQLKKAHYDAPSLSEFSENDLVQFLIDHGRLILLHNVALKQHLLFHVETISQAATALAAAFPDADQFTTSQARKALGTSRRVVVPLLEHFDSLGVTTRQENTRQLVDLNLVSSANRP